MVYQYNISYCVQALEGGQRMESQEKDAEINRLQVSYKCMVLYLQFLMQYHYYILQV